MENKISESIWGMLLRISLFLLPCATTQQKQQTIIDPQGDEFRTNLGTVGVAPAGRFTQVPFKDLPATISSSIIERKGTMRIFVYFIIMLVSLSSCATVTNTRDTEETRGRVEKGERAVEEMRARAEKGEAFAQQVMGMSYLLGSGVPRDHVAARFWLRKAADQGDAYSQIFLGKMLYEGWGGPQDYAEALTWYRKAAEQGNADAQSNLGSMYAEGRGVPQDSVRAYMWMSLAAPSLSGDGKKKVTDRLATLARSMTPQQLEQAQAMAQACRAARYQHCD